MDVVLGSGKEPGVTKGTHQGWGKRMGMKRSGNGTGRPGMPRRPEQGGDAPSILSQGIITPHESTRHGEWHSSS